MEPPTGFSMCLKREVFEETGLDLFVHDEPFFLREFLNREHDILNLELFFQADYISGGTTIENVSGNGQDDQYIKDVKWFSIDEIQDKRVFPEELKQNFGKNIKKIYLGRR